MISSLSFFLTDIFYKKDNSSKLTIFGRKKNNEKVILEAEFSPYFWIEFIGSKNKIKEKLSKICIADFHEREVNGQKKELIKAQFKSPEQLVEIKKEIITWPEVKELYEYDIPFKNRFLIDNKLKQFKLCNAKVDGTKLISINSEQETYSPKILAYDIEVESSLAFPTPEKDKILFISFYGTDDFKKVITWKKFKTNLNYIEFVSSEKELIEKAIETFEKFDSDIIVGYNSDKFDMPFLKERAEINKSKFELSWIKNFDFLGISNLDVLISIRKIMSQNLRTNRYDLGSVSKEMLGLDKLDFNPRELNRIWEKGTNEELEKATEYNLNDSVLAYKILENILPSLIELNNKTNIFLEDSSKMNFGMLVEWFLINEHFNAGKIVQNRPSYHEAIDRERKKVKGAYVFKPNAGLYENLYVLDFRSLYPSIICAHNISPDKTDFIPNLLKKLIYERKKIKDEMKGKFSSILDAKQFSLKILANSFYGYYGFPQSRWYSRDATANVTAYGRKYIKELIKKAQEKFEVVYGDTDSIFITTEKTKKQILEFVNSINKSLPKDIELEYEEFYETGLFLSKKSEEKGAKKRYALKTADGKIIIKGLEAIRGDWSNLAKKTQIEVIKKVLSEKNANSALKYVQEVIKKIKNHNIELDDLIIRTRLLKPLNKYKISGPHISAARIYQQLGEKITANFMVEYIVCKGPKKNISDRVRLPHQVNISDYDEEFYIQHQVIRAVYKIFELFKISLDDISKNQTSLSSWK